METWSLYLIISGLVFALFSVYLIYILIGSLRDNLVFRPTRTHLNNVGDYTDVRVGDVHTRWYQTEGNDSVLFYLHGNSGNVSDREYAAIFAELSCLDLVLIDYRGYGKSGGTPSIRNMREDGDSVMELIKTKYRPENIIVMSESLGSIAASYIAARHKVRCVLVLAGISSFQDIASSVQGGVSRMLLEVVLGKLDDDATNNALLAKSMSPVMFVHSEADKVVPYRCALKNKEVVPGAQLVTIEGGHSTPVISEESLREMLTFMCLDVDRLERYAKWRKCMKHVGGLAGFRIVEM